MQKKQVYNPYLPLHEYIPDGEPHVFGDRVYIFGSHDREGGYTFCMEDYVTYSAPVDDLSDWRYEGVIYRAEQDPRYPNPQYMYAPDVIRGNDGRYYLYYCMGGDYGYGGYSGPISVAVCDTPAGKYEFLGVVKNPDGSPMMKYVCFDPAVINDNGTIRVYYGTQYGDEERSGLADEIERYYKVNGSDRLNGDVSGPNDNNVDSKDINNDSLTRGKGLDRQAFSEEMEKVIETEINMFGRTREEILSYPDSINGAVMVVLEDDMLTVKEEAKHIIPYKVKGTSFEEHPFFEGPSMRKVGERYYFIYSSWQNHELCYAVSDYPDRDFTFGGTVVSNGDVGLNGRRAGDKLNMTGTTHGSICEIAGQWYVFFHRLTHKSDYSRQACAEKIRIEADGSIKQAELTSCGLNDGPLKAAGRYPAVICCNLTNGNMPHGSNSVYTMPFPNVTNLGEDRFIGEIEDGTLIGYKYFEFQGVKEIGVKTRFENDDNRVVFDGPVRLDDRCAEDEARLHEKETRSQDDMSHDGVAACVVDSAAGNKDVKFDSNAVRGDYIEIRLVPDGESVGCILIDDRMSVNKEGADSFTWHELVGDVSIPDGIHPVYLIYHGSRKIQIKDILFR